MVASSAVSVLAVGEAAPAAGLSDPQAAASIAAYLESGRRIRGLTDVALVVCVGMFVLVALAWALGVLPGAVKLF
jgi:hypothetical protein